MESVVEVSDRGPMIDQDGAALVDKGLIRIVNLKFGEKRIYD